MLEKVPLFSKTKNISGSSVPDAPATPIPPLNLFRITGFGMGADREIGEVPTVKGGTTLRTVIQPGGITFKDIEDLQISLGPGNNKFTVDDSPLGTLTRLNTGAGDDVVNVHKIQGHTFVNGGARADTFSDSPTPPPPPELLRGFPITGAATPLILRSPSTGGSPAPPPAPSSDA